MKDWLRRSLIVLILLGSLVLGMTTGEISSMRIQSLLLAVILIAITYLWAKELIGRWWALLPTYLLALSPTLLAQIQGNADTLALSLSINLALLSFLGYLINPNWFKFILASLAFGFSVILSLEALVLIPYLLLITILFYFVNKKFLLVPCVGILIFGFTMFGAFAFFMETNAPFYVNGVLETLQNLVRNSIFEWPKVFFYKEPTASLVLIVFAFVSSLVRIIRSTLALLSNRSRVLLDYLTTHFTEFAMIIFIIFWLRLTMLNDGPLGMNDLLPIAPLIYILTVSAARRWFTLEETKKIRNLMVKFFIMSRELFGLSIKTLLLAVLLIWHFFTALTSVPDFSNYLNIFHALFSP